MKGFLTPWCCGMTRLTSEPVRSTTNASSTQPPMPSLRYNIQQYVLDFSLEGLYSFSLLIMINNVFSCVVLCLKGLMPPCQVGNSNYSEIWLVFISRIQDSRPNLIYWQSVSPALKSLMQVCDGLFVDYHWKEGSPSASAAFAGPRANQVYMGVDVFGRGTFGT